MTNADYTHLIFVLDRSGSMSSKRLDTIEGFNAFHAEQSKQPGKMTMTLVQFDHEYEILHSIAPLSEVPLRSPENYMPRGMTRLLDAVGRAVVTDGEKLAALKEENRPGLVMVVILTDGAENDSNEYTRDQVRKMLTEQQEKWGWQVSYLGASLDAVAQAKSMGIDPAMAAQVANTGRGMGQGMAVFSAQVTRGRACSSRGLDPDAIRAETSYSAEERESLMAPPEDKK